MIGIRQALVWVTAANYYGLIVRFALLAAVSRLLTPEEVGVSVIGTGSVAIAFSLREFVTSDFLIQRKELAREDVRTVFTLLFGFTGLIAGAILALSPWIARYYAEPGLSDFLYVSAAAGLLEMVPLPITALLRREMAFNLLPLIDAAGVTTGAIVTLVLAALGFSYMSVAWAWLCSAAAATALVLCLRPHLWVFRPSLRSWRAVLSFGSCNGLTVLLLRVYDALPQLVLGRILPLSAVGLYNRAGAICGVGERLILSQISSVALPAFAAKAREGREVRQAYLRAISYITVLHWPAQVVLALLAHPIVMIMVGRQWTSIVPLVQIMCLSGLFWSPGALTHQVLVALGGYRHSLIANLVARPLSALVLCAASLLGLTALAASQFLTWPFQMYVALHFIRRHVPYTWGELATVVWKSTLVTACSALGPAVAMALAGFRSDLPIGAALAAALLSALCWAVGLRVAGHPFLLEIQNLVRAMERSSPMQQLMGSRLRLRNR